MPNSYVVPVGMKCFLGKRKLILLCVPLLEGSSVFLKRIFNIYLVVHWLSPEEYRHISFAV